MGCIYTPARMYSGSMLMEVSSTSSYSSPRGPAAAQRRRSFRRQILESSSQRTRTTYYSSGCVVSLWIEHDPRSSRHPPSTSVARMHSIYIYIYIYNAHERAYISPLCSLPPLLWGSIYSRALPSAPTATGTSIGCAIPFSTHGGPRQPPPQPPRRPAAGGGGRPAAGLPLRRIPPADGAFSRPSSRQRQCQRRCLRRRSATPAAAHGARGDRLR
jgi:hypothetical protein